MKRCSECRRDYYDDTLVYCLDDGSALLEGPAGGNEQETAILHSTEPPGETATRAHIHTTDLSEDSPTNAGYHNDGRTRLNKKLLLGAAFMVVLGLAGLLGYRYFVRDVGAIKSIAVLPFQNRSGDQDAEYLSDGLAESLIYRLSQLPNLKVSPTSSVIRYKGKETDVAKIAGELGVDAVMTGRLSQVGDNITISVELVDVRNNQLLWGEQYDRKMSQLLATQREIANEITQKLQLKLSGEDTHGLTKHYTDSDEAYQLYLKGRYHFAKRTKDDILKSIDYFEQAIKLDPSFALAYTGIADSYSVMPSYPYLSPKEAFPQSKAAAERALAIDPTLAEAHNALARVLAIYGRNWAEAEKEFKRALEIDPNSANIHYNYALNYLLPMGRIDEAIAEVKRAVELEPLSLAINANLGATYIFARQYDRALEQTRKTYDLEPNFITGQYWLAEAYVANGMYDEAIALSQKLLQTDPTAQRYFYLLGYAYAKAGRSGEAKEMIRKLKDISSGQYVIFPMIARIYAALGEHDEAFAQLERGYQERDFVLIRLKTDPGFDPLRGDPRYKDLLKRMGLPE